jgi:hypothetical protein
MASDINSIVVGEVWRAMGMVAKASGSAITEGSVSYYLKCLSGTNAGKWWDNANYATVPWAVGEVANAMTHQKDGLWTISLAASPFTAGIMYAEAALESGDLHVAGEGRLLRGVPVNTLADVQHMADAVIETASFASGSVGTTQEITDAVAAAIAAAHGSGSYQTANDVGIGSRTVTITINDGATVLESAKVRLTKGTETYVSTTNSSGVVAFSLNDGTWTVSITLVGYHFTPTTIVVNGNETQTYSMTAFSITAPSDASLCTVQFRVKLSNTAVAGAVCKAKLLGVNQASDGTILSNAESSDTTDASGVAELELVQASSIVKGSGIYRITIEIAGKPIASVETKIPSQATCLFEDLL